MKSQLYPAFWRENVKESKGECCQLDEARGRGRKLKYTHTHAEKKYNKSLSLLKSTQNTVEMAALIIINIKKWPCG